MEIQITGFEKIESYLATVATKVQMSIYSMISDLTEYTRGQMKFYISTKSKHPSGRLASAISSKTTLFQNGARGMVFVNNTVPYRFIQEYGTSKGDIIRPKTKKALSFGVGKWDKAIGFDLVTDRYVFKSVTRGNFEGKHYLEKSFEDLQKYAEKNKGRLLDKYIKDMTDASIG